MIKRKCPKCGNRWYSAASQDNWKCECGKTLTPQLNKLAGQENPAVEKPDGLSGNNQDMLSQNKKGV